MTQHAAKPLSDLVILVPDADLENAVAGIFRRPASLRIRPVTPLIRRHQGRDPGCRTLGVDFLRMYSNTHAHALLIFDHEGCGREMVRPEVLEAELDQLLASNGWQDRAAAIVISPELEVWAWSDSPEVDQVVGWGGRIPTLRDWLVDEGFAASTTEKPNEPKAAFHRALRTSGKRPSPALFRQLAERVSLGRCSDRSFQRMLTIVQTWFPPH